MGEITRNITADKEGLIEYLREAQSSMANQRTTIRSPQKAFASGYRAGLEYAIGVLEDWDGVTP